MTRTSDAVMTWQGDLRFEGGSAPGAPTLRVDGDGADAPSPVTGLLLAGAACAGSDVVLILTKMRVKLESLRISANGVRRDEEPRRFLAIHYLFELTGEGLDDAKARRAVDLSVEKYCSVLASLAPDIDVTHEVRVG